MEFTPSTQSELIPLAITLTLGESALCIVSPLLIHHTRNGSGHSKPASDGHLKTSHLDEVVFRVGCSSKGGLSCPRPPLWPAIRQAHGMCCGPQSQRRFGRSGVVAIWPVCRFPIGTGRAQPRAAQLRGHCQARMSPDRGRPTASAQALPTVGANFIPEYKVACPMFQSAWNPLPSSLSQPCRPGVGRLRPARFPIQTTA